MVGSRVHRKIVEAFLDSMTSSRCSTTLTINGMRRCSTGSATILIPKLFRLIRSIECSLPGVDTGTRHHNNRCHSRSRLPRSGKQIRIWKSNKYFPWRCSCAWDIHAQPQDRPLNPTSSAPEPMPLQSRPLPFDHPDWVFEHKYDGFRALAGIEHGRAQLISRNGNPFESFADLAKNIATCIPNTRLTVLDVKSCAWTRRASHSSTICYSTVVIHAPSRLTCWFVKTRTGAWRGSWIG